MAADADPDWATDLLHSRLLEFDDGAEVWVDDGQLTFGATRSDLTEEQLGQWARALAHRLRGAGLLSEADIEVHVEEAFG